MISYHIDIARYATQCERKWIDNLLSHFDIPGVERARQGSLRRIAPTGIYHIALSHRIVVELNTTLNTAVALAQALLRTQDGELALSRGLSLKFDRRAFESAIDGRIAEAVEAIVPARRGRPPKYDRAGN